MYIKLGLGVNKLDRVCQSVSMPCKPRIVYPGAIDDLLSRGDRREDVFLNLPACLPAMSLGRTLSKPWPKAASKLNSRSMLTV